MCILPQERKSTEKGRQAKLVSGRSGVVPSGSSGPGLLCLVLLLMRNEDPLSTPHGGTSVTIGPQGKRPGL
jgi:hypothetical protein